MVYRTEFRWYTTSHTKTLLMHKTYATHRQLSDEKLTLAIATKVRPLLGITNIENVPSDIEQPLARLQPQRFCKLPLSHGRPKTPAHVPALAMAITGPHSVLAHLVHLNTQRAQEEAQGRVRWLRPDFQNPQNSLSKQELLPQEEQAQEADLDMDKSLSKPEQIKPPQQPWPTTLPEQVRAVAGVLAASPAPLTLPAIEARFKGRGPWKKGLPTLLQTLEALGRAHPVPTDGGTAWRG